MAYNELTSGRVRHAAIETHGTRITGPEFDEWLAIELVAARIEGAQAMRELAALKADGVQTNDPEDGPADARARLVAGRIRNIPAALA